MISASAVTAKLTDEVAAAGCAPCALCGHRFAVGEPLYRITLYGVAEDVAGQRNRGAIADKTFCQIGCAQSIFKIAERLGAPANTRASMIAGKRQTQPVKRALVEILTSKQVCKYG